MSCLAGHAGSPTSGRVRRQPPIEAGCRTACRTGRPGTAISPLVTPSALDCDNAHRGVTGPKTGHQVGTCTPTGASMNVGNCGPRAADTTRDGGFPRRIRGGRSLSLGDRCCRASVPSRGTDGLSHVAKAGLTHRCACDPRIRWPANVSVEWSRQELIINFEVADPEALRDSDATAVVANKAADPKDPKTQLLVKTSTEKAR